MTREERLALFERELNLIHHPTIRSFVSDVLAEAPEYFFHVPASSSGKYHPAYTLGEGGLVRHTKAAIKIAESLIRANVHEWGDFTISADEFSSIVIGALILHDTYKLGIVKSGEEQPMYSDHAHPEIIFSIISQKANEWANERKVDRDEYAILNLMAFAVRTHMGKWTVSPHSPVILTEPYNWVERFVHMCDYLASRKFIDIKQLEGDTNE